VPLELLRNAGRVTVVSAPPGSGKTVLLRSWIAADNLAGQTAWVSAEREERDPQRFWISVLDGLRGTAAAAALLGPLTAAPTLDGWAVVERLLEDLNPLKDQVWLVIDDVHELPADALRQLELLVLRAPPVLRLVLATRHDVRLGLHRLRLQGQLTEIRASDLRFTREEAGALLEAAGVQLSEAAVGRLCERTEGWAAGLRLAALSLSGHPDPERFAEQFSGSERTVAEYLLSEVLERQDEPVRRLLLRTSVLERVTGELADVLTGEPGGERILQDLERAGAFVVSLDPARSWFRYHRLFAGLLQLELRRTAREDIPTLHVAAATWLAEHGYPAEAVRQAQAAREWELAARLLADHSLDLVMNGHAADVQQLLTGFPPALLTDDAELAHNVAGLEVLRGSLDEAQRYLALAERGSAALPAERQARLRVRLAVLRLHLASQRVDLPAAAAEAERLLALTDAPYDAQLVKVVGEDLRAETLIGLGASELWAARFDLADRHLEQGIAIARRIGSPYLELGGLAHRSQVEAFRSPVLAEQHSKEAIELAERHGWGDEPMGAIAYGVLGAQLVVRGHLDQAQPLLERAERNLRVEVRPAGAMFLRSARGTLELARGHHAEALAAFQHAERLPASLATPRLRILLMRGRMLLAWMRTGETERVEATLAELGSHERDSTEMRVTLAALRLTQHNPQAASAALVPVLDGSATAEAHPQWKVEAWLLEASARETLGDAGTAERALERALDAAESESLLLPFLLHPAPALLERYARRNTAHIALASEALNSLAGLAEPAEPRPRVPLLLEPLTDSETRVLHYLPTHLTAPEIAVQLHLSVHTVTTHMRHLYAKLGAHRRNEAVAQARILGLLASSPRGA
jgi:LuxR family maltose regulon positive regulatory protein